ncbi:MAG TPA: MoaD/ThiS family protein [Dissulfurispiraceae bacterium]|nr:MoaD/ThiS family protein [Dissulfurispiraceae bacterium]
MNITINLFATLRKDRFDSARQEYPSGTNVRHVLSILLIPESEAAIIFVNGRHAEPDSELRDGDALSIFPPIGGG